MQTSFLHYQVVGKLGEGGMGVVYHARDTKLKRSVALKFLPRRIAADSSERLRLLQEAQSAAALNHPHIAQVYAIEEMGDELFIVMEHVQGVELKQAIEEEKLSMQEKCLVATQIAQGIKAAHDKGVIHRDIKTRNIMLDQEGNVKIMDFGLAHVQGSEHITKTGTTLGTTAYMAPEILAGQRMDERSDIWAFGVVMYELFTGQLPFQGVYEPAVMYAITEEEPPPASEINPDIPESFSNIIQQCLVKDKEYRYQHVDAIIADFDNDTQSASTGPHSDSSAKKSRAYLLKMAALPILLLLLIYLFFSRFIEPTGAGIPDKRYLAVLPIENIGNNAAMQSICDGLAEIFSFKLSELEQYEDFYWVAPASEMRKEQVKSASQANKLFGVNLVISSSIQTTQDSTRLILELVDADKVRRLETKQVVVAAENLALLEQHAVRAMLEMLQVEMNPQIYKQLEKGGPTNSDAYAFYLKGRASLQDYASQDSLKAAIVNFQQAIDIDPSFSLAHAGLGEAFWRRFESEGDVEIAEKAESELKIAMDIDDDLAPVQALMGMVKAGRGNYELAIRHFTKALEIDPNYSPAYRGLASVYDEQGEKEKAAATYNYAISLKPEVWEGYNDLGSHYLRSGNFEEASALYQKVIELTPKNSNAYSNLGTSYYMQGKVDKAIEAYQMSLTLDKDPTVASNLATLYFVRGSYEQSAKMYQIALEQVPNRYEIWANLAAAYEANGKREEARESYLKAIERGVEQLEINPNNAELMADLGAYYSDVGDSASARKFVEKALMINDENIWIRQRAVSTYEKLGLREEALKWINGAMINDIESQPELANLVKDPQYQAIKQKLAVNPKQ